MLPRAPSDLRERRGPFDVVGDVHGCLDELVALLRALGYGGPPWRHPDGRTLVLVGDLVDRGPDTPGVLALAEALVASGVALCAAGNHDDKLARKLAGNDVRLSRGISRSLEQLCTRPPEEVDTAARFLAALPAHLLLDGGDLVVAHAGLPAHLHGKDTPYALRVALYGVVTGERDERGYPVREAWGEKYRGRASVVYGHTVVDEAVWVNRTICVDTGCVFGGRLTALRWPERTLVSVGAARVYFDADGGD